MFIFLFENRLFSQTRIFPTNTYLDSFYYGSKEFTIRNMYFGRESPFYLDGVIEPCVIETENELYLQGLKQYYFLNKDNIKINEYNFPYFNYKKKQQYLIYGGNFYAIRYEDFCHDYIEFGEPDKQINELGEILHKTLASKEFDFNTYELKTDDEQFRKAYSPYI